MAWRSGGRQRAMWRNVKGERRADAEAALALATACDESRAYAESIQSAAELKERRLYEEKEEARQLAVAMAQSAAESGGVDRRRGSSCIPRGLRRTTDVSPCDIQLPTRVPRVSDNSEELKFSRKCRARHISFGGRAERSQRKLETIGAARSMAEAVMVERFGIEI